VNLRMQLRTYIRGGATDLPPAITETDLQSVPNAGPGTTPGTYSGHNSECGARGLLRTGGHNEERPREQAERGDPGGAGRGDGGGGGVLREVDVRRGQSPRQLRRNRQRRRAPSRDRRVRAMGAGRAAEKLPPLEKLDPTLHPELMAGAEALEYSGVGRKYFLSCVGAAQDRASEGADSAAAGGAAADRAGTTAAAADRFEVFRV